ncbi:FHA domain-containing protein [Lachnospiraceae bacterium 54-53]
MERNRKLKSGLDLAILICAIFISLCFLRLENGRLWIWGLAGAAGLAAAIDLILQLRAKGAGVRGNPAGFSQEAGVRQLMLLDEHDKPLKSWDLAGKTALVIGRKNDDEDVDVDLEDCEYSTFIDCQHAVLNYCLDSWYLEDLSSKNGVRIRKVEDGGCYQVTGRPCRLSAGDVIYIANTRLLLT